MEIDVNIQKESEAFDLWWEGNAIAMMCEEGEALKIWQAAKAQAVPEGFALVPVETLNEALSWANCATSESWTDVQREDIDKHYMVIERAMIEAQEPNND